MLYFVSINTKIQQNLYVMHPGCGLDMARFIFLLRLHSLFIFSDIYNNRELSN